MSARSIAAYMLVSPVDVGACASLCSPTLLCGCCSSGRPGLRRRCRRSYSDWRMARRRNDRRVHRWAPQALCCASAGEGWRCLISLTPRPHQAKATSRLDTHAPGSSLSLVLNALVARAPRPRLLRVQALAIALSGRSVRGPLRAWGCASSVMCVLGSPFSLRGSGRGLAAWSGSRRWYTCATILYWLRGSPAGFGIALYRTARQSAR